jgi:hypothetical protein
MTAPLTASLPEASSPTPVKPIFTVLIGTYNCHHFDDFYAQRKNRAVRAKNSGHSREKGDAAR